MKISGSKGFSSIVTLLALLLMAGMGGAIAYMISVNQSGRGDHLQSLQAFYVTQAGIEYVIKKIYDMEDDGNFPVPVNFGRGNFTSAKDGITLTVTGTVGDSVRVHSVDSPTQADCNIIDATGVNSHNSGSRISAITFRKNCYPTITVVGMTISWVDDNGERMEQIRIEEDTIYNNPAGVASGTAVDTEDYLLDNPNNYVINRIEFDSDMRGKTMTLQFNMEDTSAKTTTFVVP